MQLDAFVGPNTGGNGVKGSHWAITYFPPEDGDFSEWLRNFEDRVKNDWSNRGIKYVRWQQERCPDTGKLHLQMYVNSSQMRRRALLAIIGNCWCKPLQKGPNFELNTAVKHWMDYCWQAKPGRIDDTQFEWPGENARPFNENGKHNKKRSRDAEPGKRNDLVDYIEAIKSGKCSNELILDSQHTKVIAKYPKWAERVEKVVKKIETNFNNPKTVLILCGPSGTQKSRRCWDFIRECKAKYGWRYYKKEQGDQWWTFYENEEIIFIDEFSPLNTGITLETMNNVMDRYPHTYPAKGSHVELNHKVVIIASNYHPRDWYPKANFKWADGPRKHPLLRRIHDYGKLFLTSELHNWRAGEPLGPEVIAGTVLMGSYQGYVADISRCVENMTLQHTVLAPASPEQLSWGLGSQIDPIDLGQDDEEAAQSLLDELVEAFRKQREGE